MTGTLYCKKHRPSDETLNRGLDSSWSLKIPGCPSKKSRGVTPASWPNLPIGLWPSWPPNNLHIYWLHHFVSSPPVSWSVVGVLVHYGCRRIIQVDAVHWWWMRRYAPYYVKRFECLENPYITVANYIIELYRECKKKNFYSKLWTLCHGFRVRGTQLNTRVHLKTSVSHEQKTRDQYVFFSSWNSTRDHLKNSMLAFRMLPRGQLNISFVLSCQWAKSKGWERKTEFFFSFF